MNPKSIVAVLLLSFASVSSFASECRPIAHSTAGETMEVLSGGENFGADAASEIRAMIAAKANVATTADLLGRDLATIAKQPISGVDSIVEEDETASAQKIRYCSKSTTKNAKCVDVCHRWTNYERYN